MDMDTATSTVGFFTEYKDAIDGWKNIGLLIAGFVGLLFLGVRAKAQSVSARSAQRQADLAEKGHITERYIKAIDQLGATHGDGKPNLEVRLGGIYGLERVAHESDDLYQQIIEVLTAYVRTNAIDPLAEYHESKLTADFVEEKQAGLKADVQAVITVLGRRKKMENEKPMDFSYAYLPLYNFEGGNFSEANFRRANCWGANFSETDCSRVVFVETRCEKARFKSAKCRNALFNAADCRSANFKGADCTDVRFTEADCTKANFTKSTCKNSDFSLSTCTKAVFTTAYCKGANFVRGNFQGAMFASSNLTDASFFMSDCTKANFIAAICKKTIFTNSNIGSANFKGVNIKYIVWEGVNFSLANVPPTDFSPEKQPARSGDT